MEQRTTRLPALTAAAFMLFLVLVGSFWPKGKEVLREILIPGDPAVTVAALEDLAEELKTGTELDDALENFCQTVVREADLDHR